VEERDRRGRVALRWLTAGWLFVIITLSVVASERPLLLLPWVSALPGRDKTGHFLLMGSFAFVSVLAFAGTRHSGRRIPAPLVLCVVGALVIAEEGVQQWLPRRNFSLIDLASSLAGVAALGGLAVLWRARRQRTPQRKTS
jgi:VanZ family protein